MGLFYSIYTADVNRDGYLDIIVGGYASDGSIGNYPIYLRNNGSQSFEWIKCKLVAIQMKFLSSYSMSALDFNNNGYMDMLSLNGLLLNNGSHTFVQDTSLTSTSRIALFLLI